MLPALSLRKLTETPAKSKLESLRRLPVTNPMVCSVFLKISHVPQYPIDNCDADSRPECSRMTLLNAGGLGSLFFDGILTFRILAKSFVTGPLRPIRTLSIITEIAMPLCPLRCSLPSTVITSEVLFRKNFRYGLSQSRISYRFVN